MSEAYQSYRENQAQGEKAPTWISRPDAPKEKGFFYGWGCCGARENKVPVLPSLP